LAPGYIDLLANKLFQQFCKDFKVDKVDKLEFKVGALTNHAVAPHYYGFTWSPVGVATEYIKDAVALRDFKKISLPALSERATIIIEGIAYEEDLTSGGAADLPDALEGKVSSLDYKTLRHPGHYAWVQKQLAQLENNTDFIKNLQQKMEAKHFTQKRNIKTHSSAKSRKILFESYPNNHSRSIGASCTIVA